MNFFRIFLVPLAAIFLILSSSELTSAAYQLLGPANGVGYNWDGTYANRQISENVDYRFDYGPEAKVDFTLPWLVPFNGVNYNQITAHANGSVRIGGPTGPLVHAWNADLSSYYFGGVFVQRKTNPDRVVVEWATETFDSAGYSRLNSFEAVLDPSGGIRVDYRAFDPASSQDAGSGLTSPADGIDLSITNTYGPVTGFRETSFLFLPQQTFTITATISGGGTINPAGAIVASGDNQAFTIVPDPGYRIADVLVDGFSQGAISSYTFTAVAANHTISASFITETSSYTITSTAGANGTISPSGSIAVNGGESTSFVITPDSGYWVSDVVVDGSSVGSRTEYTFPSVLADHNIHASFGPTITASSGSGGGITPAVANVVSGNEVTFTITPEQGFQVAEVLVDGVSVGPVASYTFTNVVVPHIITATFTAGSSLVPAFQSDEFNSTIMSSFWQFVDPLGDSTLSFTGTQASIFAPAGVEHDLWTAGNFAPRIMQQALDADFEAEARFDSSLISRYQFQGIVIEQDATNFMRFEFLHDGTSTRLFVAAITGTTASTKRDFAIPSASRYLRLKRSSDQWEVLYSSDGLVWTSGVTFIHAAVVSSIGVYGGNAGDPIPAHTALVDYFRCVQLMNLAASTTENAATITWDTDVPSTSMVKYGLTASYELGTVEDANMVFNHSIDLSGLSAGTAHHFQASSMDIGGNVALAPDKVFSTSSQAQIQSDEFNSITLNPIWRFINPRSDSSSYTMTGSQISIYVPPGVEHDLWTMGNYAPRIIQNLDNSDFEVEVKFDSSVTQKYQMQGIVVENDASNFIRCEFHYNGSSTRLFVATVAGTTAITQKNVSVSSASKYMRVKRTGDQWQVSYSTDGATWTSGVTFTCSFLPTGIGVYGGNAYPTTGGSAPQHTAVIDYFRKLP